MIHIIHCWIPFVNILFRIFASIFMTDIGLHFSFLVVSLLGFGISVLLASLNTTALAFSFGVCIVYIPTLFAFNFSVSVI